MNAAVRLSGYAATLVLVFAAAWGVGVATGAPAAAPARADTADAPGATAGHGTGEDHADSHAAGDGLVATAAGYTLVPRVSTLAPGRLGEFDFTITGSDGRPVTAFDVEHGKQMHLVVVRRDAAGFQHLHPALGPDGVWRVPLELPAAGVYRAFADFAPTGGQPITLGVDLSAPGDFQPATYAESRVSDIGGYRVELTGDLAAGQSSPVTATITRDGQRVTDLQPYLAAFGHLVTLRQTDLAYLHVHPDGSPGDGHTPAGPGISFYAEVPSAGAYRLFLNFQHQDVVRTAEFTITAGSGHVPEGAGPVSTPAPVAPAPAITVPVAPAPAIPEPVTPVDPHHGGAW